jgi:alanine dehydrogenase
MDIGVVKEVGACEHRVALIPQAAAELVAQGHRVFVEKGAGQDARFEDREYVEAGAQIAYQHDEVLRRGQILLGIHSPSSADLDLLEPGQVVFGFHHLIVAPKETILKMRERRITAIGYEAIEEADGTCPILSAFGNLAGQMVPYLAAQLLQREGGGRGVLLGTVAGIKPTRILILGAGTVGRTAAALLVTSGAKIILLVRDLAHLERARRELPGSVETYIADAEIVARFAADAHVIIGAVRIPGERAPYLVTRNMVSGMRPGSVIIDVAIDQGGCVETSRPTTLAQPTFKVGDVVHYCVPTLTANIPRTASKVLSRTAGPYLTHVAREGIGAAIATSEPIRKGTHIRDGVVASREIAARVGG